MRVLVGIACFGILGGCLRQTTYKCTDNGQCEGGACEPDGLCSFPDSSCASGRKYGDLSGDSSGKCVGEGGGDGGVDVPIDMAGCPMGYTASGTSSYRFVSTAAAWLAAEMDCENDGTGTHLVVINDMTEEAAVNMLVNGNFWLGASDRVSEGDWLWVTGGAAPDLGMSNGNDCARSTPAGMATDQDCDMTAVYVCECDGMAAMPASYTP